MFIPPSHLNSWVTVSFSRRTLPHGVIYHYSPGSQSQPHTQFTDSLLYIATFINLMKVVSCIIEQSTEHVEMNMFSFPNHCTHSDVLICRHFSLSGSSYCTWELGPSVFYPLWFPGRMKNVNFSPWQYRNGNPNHKPKSKSRKVSIFYFVHSLILGQVIIS